MGADALPTSCTFTGQNGGKTASARCTGGTGQVRVYVKCYDSLRGSYVGEYDGPWVKVGATSRVTCPREGNVQTIIEGGGFDVR
ncbi:hypothetical protein [Jatrophihabitans endophyticus]|uniref:hypothetical protein n=1 Tax=Jatrophihabitans endophyticus TaxID=1206085 RepID=UPI000932B2ED|nr:hypothetical protein [Jatrophihabitans endophyticus]